MPRHPPNALTTLDRSHCQWSSLSGFGKPILRTDVRRGAEAGHTDTFSCAAPVFPEDRITFYNPDIHDDDASATRG
jgi:hypothetical protein